MLPGDRLGPYEVLAKIGEGGMGEVYRARDPRLGRNVAIKILPAAFSTDSDRLWRFEREARAIASLNHPNICTIHDIGEHDGHRYLVMELLEGLTLGSTLETGPLPNHQLLDLAIQIADALDAAHGAGIIHRDLKPANIFVTKRGEAKLLDFGLAKLEETLDGDAGATALQVDPADAPTLAGRRGETTVGTLLGTAAYMSPEQARGEPADAQSDLFSFGVVLYEMATGKPAFSGKTMAVLFDGILNKDPRPIAELNPRIPAELTHVVAKAIEKDKDLRYRTASDIRADLKRLKRDSAPRRIVGDDEPIGSAQGTPSNSAQGRSTGAGSIPHQPSTIPTPPATPIPSAPAAIDERKKRRRRSPRRRVFRAAALVFLILVFGRSALRRLLPREAAPAPASIESLQVTKLTSTGNASRPAISPDGRYVVYLQDDGDNASSVWLRQTGATNSVKILPSDPMAPAMGATVGPDSTFVDVWTTNGVWRVPFLGGSGKKIIDRSSTPIGWSPDGQRMTFVRANPSGPGQELVTANRNGEDIQVIGTRRGAASGDPNGAFATGLPGALAVAPAWSPDGKRVAALMRLGEDVREMGLAAFDITSHEPQVVSVRGDVPLGYGWLDSNTLVLVQALEQGTPSQVWRIRFPDGHRSRLTNDASRYADVSVSADGSTFVTSHPETRASVWVGDATGRGNDIVAPTPFLSSGFDYAGVAWDGNAVLFTHTLNGHFEIFRIDADGSGTPQPIVAGRDFTVGADGAIAYRTVTGDNMGLWKVDRDGRHPIELAKTTANFPLATDDGQQVVFSAPIGGPQSVWRIPLAGGTPPQLVKSTVSIYGYSNVSPDGRSIVVFNAGQWLICDFPQCGEHKPLRLVGGRPVPRWMPDARGISYVAPGATANLWVQPLDGSPARQLTHFDDGRGIGQYAWSRKGRLVMSRLKSSSDIVLFKGLKN